MDAREYLNRKGVGLEREPERPNTLEEKAWERARGSGNQRPKAGTPHDWEDWERFHDDLTEGVETLEQKINKEAHRKALARAQEKAEASEAKAPNTQVTNTPAHAPDPVGHYTPPAVAQPASLNASQASPGQPTVQEPAALRLAYRALAILLPPLAVGLTDGGGQRVATATLLTLLGWVPGVIYAWRWLGKHHAER
ncbi:YqaE/Pmp3 family membrane protein [Vreelandella hamiltonii]|uniref:YqaE/Pmp3 family membrane protein n=1 Tax=Vreelandella hamiltonii TaxID=502829 RepID=A0A8H9I388_9GAMM|nr:YqaE/Pmp3 family membrane protein [Halomonas hamiltonii]GGW25178.1 hypothetical protein GCM10007157_16310 [Halomonas hamiltonii]